MSPAGEGRKKGEKRRGFEESTSRKKGEERTGRKEGRNWRGEDRQKVSPDRATGRGAWGRSAWVDAVRTRRCETIEVKDDTLKEGEARVLED